MSVKNILITGGCGFIGVNLVHYLLSKRYTYIRILDNLSVGTRENLEDALRQHGDAIPHMEKNRITYRIKEFTPNDSLPEVTVDLIIGDIRSRNTCLKAIENIDSVVHLAAHAGVIPSVEDPFRDFEINIHGTLNLLYSSVKNDVDTFIFASSNAALGNHVPPMNEHRLPRPLSPYGASKLAGEGYCAAFHRSYGLRTTTLRFSNVYGPYSLHKNSVVAKFIRDGFSRGEVTIYGDGHQTRDFIYVDDICQAIDLILNKPVHPQGSPLSPSEIWGNPLHIGTGQETSILELAELVRRLFPQEIRIDFVSGKREEIRRNYSDITQAKVLIGFSPQIPLRDGVRTVYRWYMRKNGQGIGGERLSGKKHKDPARGMGSSTQTVP